MGSATSPSVSLVVPARNAADTIAGLVRAVAPLVERGELDEIIVVDDGSTDDTALAASRAGARVLSGEGRGAASARNLGWQAASSEFVWFLDADCIAADDTLQILHRRLEGSKCAGVGGSFTNPVPQNLLAELIQEEIAMRHRRMKTGVAHLATGNVLYRRCVLAELGGFDASFRWAHDAEFSFRVRAAGHTLAFEPAALVQHRHEGRFVPYLVRQAQQGYWRVMLYRRFPHRAAGDNYSSLTDHLQPPLAVLMLAVLPALFLPPPVRWIPLGLVVLLAALQIPATWAMYRSTGRLRCWAFLPLGFVRAITRGIGMTIGLAALARPAQRAATADGAARST